MRLNCLKLSQALRPILMRFLLNRINSVGKFDMYHNANMTTTSKIKLFLFIKCQEIYVM